MLELFSGENFGVLLYLEFILRLVVACLCGLLIGTERSKRYKEAGVRTHVIVCCAAALMMIISKYGFTDLGLANGGFFAGMEGADPARLAAQVITGISFLGAGVIFKNGNTIKGLTTAAGIWATAGIGLSIGAGMYILGLAATALITLLQFIMHKFPFGADALVTSRLQFTVRDTDGLDGKIDEFLKTHSAQIVDTKTEFFADGYISYDYTVKTKKGINYEELKALAETAEDVKSVRCIPIV